ncbi:MAG TPA: endonuclease III [Verrucomicrobiae bacterium]
MPRESFAARHDRTQRIIAGLTETYPNAYCELNHSNSLELLIATILSAQCTDKQVNIVTEQLFKKYHTVQDYADAPPEQFAEDIRRIGLYRAKAKNIQSTCRKLIEHHGGNVPKTMEELTALDGVGRKTANVVLGNAFNINIGVVVDTHVGRLSNRLALTRETDPKKIEQDLMKLIPQSDWCQFSHQLIFHGRRRCYARNPDCPNCEIRTLCPSADKA